MFIVIFLLALLCLIAVWITNAVTTRNAAMVPLLEEKQAREAVQHDEMHDMNEVGRMEEYYKKKGQQKQGNYQKISQDPWPMEDEH